MDRPPVLIVEPDGDRRRTLARSLSKLGYEVVPAVDAEEGGRFAVGLGPGVILADSNLVTTGNGSFIDQITGSDRPHTLVLLGSRPARRDGLPDEVLWLPASAGITPALLRQIRLVLVGREIGVEPDVGLEVLVGDLALEPPLELVRALHRAAFTGRVSFDDGEIGFDRGHVVAASAGASRGVKAFCRLGRRTEGVFRVCPEKAPARHDVDEEVDALVIRAVEDASVGELPPPRARLRIELGPGFFSSRFSPLQQDILTAAQQGIEVGALLDLFAETDGTVLGSLLELKEGGFVALEEPGARVTIVTDSTSDLPRELVRSAGIEVLPLPILFGETRYLDGVDLRPRGFYELLEQSAVPPTTEPLEQERLTHAYRRLLGQRDVVSVHLSAKLSRTLAHAEAAATGELEELPRRRVDGAPVELELVDSESVSLGLGLLVMMAARMAHRGLGASAIAERLVGMRRRVHVVFVVDTLEFLARGGRIGKARAWVGQLLGIKPILGIRDGEVVPVDRVRGGRAAHPRIIELLVERVDPAFPVIAAVAHARAPVWADRLRSLLEESFRVQELVMTEIGPVVGAHGGPGTVGAVLFQPNAQEAPLVAPLDG